MKRVKLKAIGISYSQHQGGGYALLLEEVGGSRRLPIIIGGFEAQAIVIKLEEIVPPRPLTHDLFKTMAGKFNITISEVLINKYEGGVFYSQIFCSNGEIEYSIDSRTSDAVALALRFECPIYINEDILEMTQILTDTEKTKSVSPSTKEHEDAEISNSDNNPNFVFYSNDELYKMIDEAVNKEDYERAAFIRDEIDRRKSDK